MMQFVSGKTGGRRLFGTVVAALSLWLIAGNGIAAARQPSLQVIVDASASMEDQLGGDLKYKLVRKVAQTVLPRYDARLDLGLIAFGAKSSDSCTDVVSLAERKAGNAKAVLLKMEEVKAKGMSPIAAALNLAAPAGAPAPSEILLIADGGDNCGGNVCNIANTLAAAEPGMRVHVIGLGGTGSLRNLSCLAEATKGSFTLAHDENEIEAAVDRVLLTALTPAAAAPAATASAVAEPQTSAAVPEALPPLPAHRPKHAPPAAKAQEQVATAPAKDEARAIETAAEPAAAPAPAPATAPKLRPEREELEIKVEQPAAPAPAAKVEEPAVPDIAAPTLAAVASEAPLEEGELPLTNGMAGMSGTAAVASAPPADAGFIGKEPDLNTGLSQTEAPVRLRAFITEGGELVRSGLIWRIYKAKRDDSGRFEMVETSELPHFDTRLPIGAYLVNLSWGRSHLTEKLDVLSSKPIDQRMVLNAGGLRLQAQDSQSRPLPPQQVQWRIFAEERDQFGNRQLLIDQAPGGKIIRLNAGIYHIESVLGTANGLVEADLTVEAGKLTDAVVTHTATLVTFKLVTAPGGEALAGATWRIKSPDGAIIKETGGALPTQILAAGDYQIEAQYSGRTFGRKVTIEPGDPVRVEIVIQ
jgi:hypothetical protein